MSKLSLHSKHFHGVLEQRITARKMSKWVKEGSGPILCAGKTSKTQLFGLPLFPKPMETLNMQAGRNYMFNTFRNCDNRGTATHVFFICLKGNGGRRKSGRGFTRVLRDWRWWFSQKGFIKNFYPSSVVNAENVDLAILPISDRHHRGMGANSKSRICCFKIKWVKLMDLMAWNKKKLWYIGMIIFLVWKDNWHTTPNILKTTFLREGIQ